MMTIDLDTVKRLQVMKVNETVNFKLEDREFTIVDKEEFMHICEKAGLMISDEKYES